MPQSLEYTKQIGHDTSVVKINSDSANKLFHETCHLSQQQRVFV